MPPQMSPQSLHPAPQNTFPRGALGLGAQDPQDSSTVDRFMMTSLFDAVNDVLKESRDAEQQAAMAFPPPGNLMPVPGLGHPKALTVTLGSDGFMSALPNLKPMPSIPPLTADEEVVSSGLGPLQGPSSLKLKTPCQCGNDHIAFCMNCQEFLCSNCATAHEQALSFKDHHIVASPSNSLPSSRKTTPPSSLTTPVQSQEPLLPIDEDELDSCGKHPDEKLGYFCPTCAVLLCKVCASIEHAHHHCLGLREAFARYKPNLKDLLGKTRVEVDLLEYSLTETKKMDSRINDRQKEAIVKVQNIFQAHREAVVKREQEVINQINEITNLRVSSLRKDEENISKALESIHALLQVGESTLQDGDRYKMLVSHFKLDRELHNCHTFTNSRSPSEDDSFILKSNTVSVQSTLKTMCLFTTAPYPPLCMAMGEGLYHPRVNKLCTVILAAKDRAGEPCLEGGERLFVQLKSASGGVPIDFRDNSDGSYSINFRPRAKGEHQLVIAIRGQHVQGSPFTLFVAGGREYGHFGVLTQVFGSEGSQNGQFCRPWGICADQQGNIIVGDRSNHRIQVFDINGAFKHKFGGEGVRPGQFNRPAGVAVTREGHVVVADKDNHRIQVLKIDGAFLFMFGSKGGNDGQMIYPYDVAVNQLDGRIAVTDTGNHRLLIFSHDGILLGKFGYKGYLCGHFDSPRGIAFNDEGHIIVSDFNVHHILVIHPDGTNARILGSQGSSNGQFMRPQGIAVDHMGNFIVTDTRNNRIVIMHPSGLFVAKFGTSGSGPGQFDRPTSVAVLPDGRVAVVDFGNSRIQIF